MIFILLLVVDHSHCTVLIHIYVPLSYATCRNTSNTFNKTRISNNTRIVH